MTDTDHLLKMQRSYTSNEIIEYQKKVISDLQIEIGILKSTVAELEDKLKAGVVEPKVDINSLKTKGWTLQLLEIEYVAELKKQISSLQEIINNGKFPNYKKEVIIWRDRYFNELAKQNKEK